MYKIPMDLNNSLTVFLKLFSFHNYKQNLLSLKYFFKWRIIALQCLVVSAIHQHKSPAIMHIYPLPPFHPSRASQCTRLDSLFSVAASHYLAVLYLVVCICQCYFLNLSWLLFPPLCPQVCSLHLHLHFFSVNRFISTVFRFHIYVLIHDVCFSLFDFILCNRLSVHPPYHS